MRLGQFARKYDIRVQDLISYMESDSKEEIHSNTKLSDETEAEILDFFGLESIAGPVVEPEPEIEVKKPLVDEEASIVSDLKEGGNEIDKLEDKQPKKAKAAKKVVEETDKEDIEWDAEDSGFSVEKPTPALPETPMDDIALAEGELVTPIEESMFVENETVIEDEVVTPIEKETSVPPAEDEIIQTDKLLEMLESDEPPADLDKIKLIKAPKRELSGLKVLGKVDLPEPKQKPAPEEKTAERPNDRRRNQRPILSSEEKERRRLKAKQKQEAFEARERKRAKEREAQKLKELRESHYKKRLEQQKVASKKAKQKEKQKAVEEKTEPTTTLVENKRSEPSTVFGKVWRWLNSH